MFRVESRNKKIFWTTASKEHLAHADNVLYGDYREGEKLKPTLKSLCHMGRIDPEQAASSERRNQNFSAHELRTVSHFVF